MRVVVHTVHTLLIIRLPHNVYFFHAGYDPTNVHFQKAAEYFWNHYSLEEDSWRDQPLWCYTLEHFQVKPLLIGDIFRPNPTRMGHPGHRYDATQDNDAAASPSAASSTS
jgi:hypothetical protein